MSSKPNTYVPPYAMCPNQKCLSPDVRGHGTPVLVGSRRIEQDLLCDRCGTTFTGVYYYVNRR
jgi:hypothetical protein